MQKEIILNKLSYNIPYKKYLPLTNSEIFLNITVLLQDSLDLKTLLCSASIFALY